MSKRILAICDKEESYACRFAAWIEKKKRYPFEVAVFTSPEKLCAYAEENHVEILLAAESVLCKEVMELDAGMKVVLLEEEEGSRKESCFYVRKYQSCESIMQQIMAQYEDNPDTKRVCSVKTYKTRVIGIYSPLGRCGKTSFSLALGRILADTHKVLYLNLEPYSGFENIFSRKYDRNISDIFYDIRRKKDNLAFRISGMVHELGNMHYLPPVLCPEDIEEIKEEEWQILLNEVTGYCDYEILILDFGVRVYQAETLLRQCHKIYMPVLDDRVSRAKLTQFEEYMQNSREQEIMEKAEKICLPGSVVHSAGDWSEAGITGSFGEFVRNIVKNGDFYRT